MVSPDTYEWRVIAGFPAYVIDECGGIVRQSNHAPLKFHKRDTDGVLLVSLRRPGHRKVIPVRNLVMQAWGKSDAPSPRHRIYHIDGDLSNCSIDNLIWAVLPPDAVIPPPYDPHDLSEQWAIIQAAPWYIVSSWGRVQARVPWIQAKCKGGYVSPFFRCELCHFVRLEREDKPHAEYRLHILVARTFLPPPEDVWHLVRWIDGNPANNRVDNLRWAN